MDAAAAITTAAWAAWAAWAEWRMPRLDGPVRRVAPAAAVEAWRLTQGGGYGGGGWAAASRLQQ